MGSNNEWLLQRNQFDWMLRCNAGPVSRATWLHYKVGSLLIGIYDNNLTIWGLEYIGPGARTVPEYEV